MRVLITGATGIVGRQLIDELQGHELLALSRTEPDMSESGVRWIRQDLTLPLTAELPSRVDAVVHLAQSRRYREFPDGAEDVFAINVHSTFRLLDYARHAGAQKFVLASTGGLYELTSSPVSEQTGLAPSSPYFRSKRMAELLLDDYAGYFQCVALRFFFVYGPGRGLALVSRLAEKILSGERILIEGDPGMRINPIFATDAARAIAAALTVEEALTINVAGPEVVSISELTARLARALGREATIEHSQRAPTADLVADTRLMREKLGVEAATSLDDGLAAVARSFAVS